MNPVSPWIAALADQCLSFYLGQNDQDEVQVEDVDGCLSFSIRSPVPKAAIVVLVRYLNRMQNNERKKELSLTIWLLCISGNKESTITVPHSQTQRIRLMPLFHETRRTHRGQPLPAPRRSKEAPGIWLNFPISRSFLHTQQPARISAFTSITLLSTGMRSQRGMCRNQNSRRQWLSGP